MPNAMAQPRVHTRKELCGVFSTFAAALCTKIPFGELSAPTAIRLAYEVVTSTALLYSIAISLAVQSQALVAYFRLFQFLGVNYNCAWTVVDSIGRSFLQLAFSRTHY